MKTIDKTEKNVTIEIDVNDLKMILKAVNYLAIAARSEKYVDLRERLEKIVNE